MKLILNFRALRNSPVSCHQLTGLACGVLVLCGCGRSGLERVVVEGAVRFSGQPVERGHIRFVPENDGELPSSGGPIIAGRYRVDSRGGVPIGRHRVEITGFRVDPQFAHLATTEPAPAGFDTELPREQYLPKQYNRATELGISLASGGAVHHDFSLEP